MITASILTGGSNNFETTSEMANGLATDFVTEGIVGAITATSSVAPMTGGFAANSNSPDAMNVVVSAGVAYVQATPTGQGAQMFRVVNTASETVTIAANSTGSNRYDWVYIKIDPDEAANPDADGQNVATLVVSRSTSVLTDNGTPPTYGYCIAKVTVGNGASSIADGNIAEMRAQTGATPAEVSVKNMMLATGAGEPGGAWTSYTPTFSTLTVGNGTLNAAYTKIGRTVFFRVSVVFGSTSTMGSNTTVSLPVTSATYPGSATRQPIGWGLAFDTSPGNSFDLRVMWASTTTCTSRALDVRDATGNYLTSASTSSTVPMSWATGDEYYIWGHYEAAA